MAIHVDNCCIANGKGTMPVYLIAFEMDSVLARCREKRVELEVVGVKKNLRFCQVLLFWSSIPKKYFVCIVVYQEGRDAVVAFQQQLGIEPALATLVSTMIFVIRIFFYMYSIYIFDLSYVQLFLKSV